MTTEYVTVDRRGQPIVWPVTPYWHADEGCIDITTGLGYPKKADDARRNPHVALLFSDPTGSGLEDPPMVLVQGTASVDDQDVEANAERYARESKAKLPKIGRVDACRAPAKLLRLVHDRIYVHVRPERVYVWRDGDPSGRAGAARRAPRGGALRAQRGARGAARAAPRAAAPSGTSAWPSSARLSDGGPRRRRRPTASPSRSACPSAPDRAGAARPCRGRGGGRAAGARAGLPGRARPRAGLHLAAQLPGPRRPRRDGRRLGPGAAQGRRRHGGRRRRSLERLRTDPRRLAALAPDRTRASARGGPAR